MALNSSPAVASRGAPASVNRTGLTLLLDAALPYSHNDLMVSNQSIEDDKRGSSPASRGGAGVYIEGELGAFYFLAMLAGTEARGMPGARISLVRFQGVDQGYALDDLVLEGVGAAGAALLEIQSKREITFAPRDSTFQEVAGQIARSTRDDVPEDSHQLAVATQRTSKAISGPYQDVLLWARTALSSREFFEKIATKGVASDPMRNFVATFRSNLVAAGIADNDDVIWRVLRRFLILEFDFESTAPLARTHALALARQVLADEDISRAESLWGNLIEISIGTAKAGGAIGWDELRSKLAMRGFRLAGDRDYRPARARLADMARMTLAGIGTTVAGVHLTRLDAVTALDQATDENRLVELRGGTRRWQIRCTTPGRRACRPGGKPDRSRSGANTARGLVGIRAGTRHSGHRPRFPQ